jgi:hypothetical protein
VPTFLPVTSANQDDDNDKEDEDALDEDDGRQIKGMTRHVMRPAMDACGCAYLCTSY